ncbi:unnamed protein product [Protopolystoma xenopodis]|uniref:EGF-like domain-containing protein n=1 Tax=Protopolystoma xenopodis TaxID=117903 RepID=A0A3S5B7C7_9PLAT|nr:unnamed protein product [Protopolystoma xenopodis]
MSFRAQAKVQHVCTEAGRRQRPHRLTIQANPHSTELDGLPPGSSLHYSLATKKPGGRISFVSELTGSLLSTTTDLCAAIVCRNSGTCIVQKGVGICICAPPFSGSQCEQSEWHREPI